MTARPTRAPDRGFVSARDLRRRKKAQQIIEAAKEVFLEVGFSEASMDGIAQKAGVSKRTLYDYFKSKEKIFIDIMQVQLSLPYKNFSTDQKDPECLADRLQRIGVDLLRTANSRETLSLFRIAAAEANRFPKLARQFFEESFEKVIDGIAGILEQEGQTSGLRVTDARQAAEYFLDLIFGTAYYRVVFGTIPPMNDKFIKAYTRRALKYFLAAC